MIFRVKASFSGDAWVCLDFLGVIDIRVCVIFNWCGTGNQGWNNFGENGKLRTKTEIDDWIFPGFERFSQGASKDGKRTRPEMAALG